LIFVTVGMHTQSFDRLLKKMDEISGRIAEEVTMQVGRTAFRPQHAKWFDFATEAEIKEFCRKARVVVTHPAMSVVDALDQGTPVIVVPRQKRYNEVIDDHQVAFAGVLEKEGKVVAVYDVDGLERTLKRSDLKTGGAGRDKRLVNALKRYIAEFERR